MPQTPIEDEWLDTLPLDDQDDFSTSPAEKAAVLVMPALTGAGCGKCSPFQHELVQPLGFYATACNGRGFIHAAHIRAERRL